MVTHGPQLDAPLADALTYPAKLIDEYPWETDLGDAFVSLTGQMTTRKVWREPVGVVGAIVPWNFPFEVTHPQARPSAGHRQHGRAEAGARHALQRDPPRAPDRRVAPTSRPASSTSSPHPTTSSARSSRSRRRSI